MTGHLRSLTWPTLDDLAAQDASLNEDCPWCHAQRDTYCINTQTGQHLRARTSHHQRITAAQQENP